MGRGHGRQVGVGLVGLDLRPMFCAAGEAVEQAKLLSRAALGGQVLMSGKTLAQTGARFDVTPLGERPLKSEQHRTAVFEVLAEDAEDSTTPGVS